MAEARRAEKGVGFLGRTRRAPSPPARGLIERFKLPQWGQGRSPGRNRFSCISKLVEGIKTVFTTKRDTVGSTPRAFTAHHFVCLIFPWNFGGVQTPKTPPLVTALDSVITLLNQDNKCYKQTNEEGKKTKWRNDDIAVARCGHFWWTCGRTATLVWVPAWGFPLVFCINHSVKHTVLS